MADIEKAINGLEWILQDDRFGFGENWTVGSEPKDDYERAGYNITRAIELLKEQQEQIEKLEYDLAVTQNNLNYYVNGND